MYLDDGFCLKNTLEKAQLVSHSIRADLFAAGFVTNEEKSVWSRVQSITWLEIIWNFETGHISLFFITEQRIRQIESKLRDALARIVLSTRELASITGSIISLSPVFGNLCRILSTHCQLSIAVSQNWESKVQLDSYCISELEFWLTNVNRFNAKDCFKLADHAHVIYSDASSFACGAVIAQDDLPICHRLFTEEEKRLSSTQSS